MQQNLVLHKMQHHLFLNKMQENLALNKTQQNLFLDKMQQDLVPPIFFLGGGAQNWTLNTFVAKLMRASTLFDKTGNNMFTQCAYLCSR